MECRGHSCNGVNSVGVIVLTTSTTQYFDDLSQVRLRIGTTRSHNPKYQILFAILTLVDTDSYAALIMVVTF